MKRIQYLVQKLAGAALHLTALALVAAFLLGAPGNALGSTGSGITCPGGQTIYESGGYTAAGCLFTSGPLPTNVASCNQQSLTISMPTNSGTCLICVQAKYAALVANDAAPTPQGYLYRQTPFNETALTLDPYGISYFDGVHTPFRCLKCAQPPSGMMAWWTLDQWGAPFVNAAPATAGQLSGQSVGAPTNVIGESGNAAYFNGKSYIEVPNASALDVGPVLANSLLSGGFSIGAWVKVDSQTNGVGVIVEKRTLNSSNQYTGYSFYLYNGYLGLQLADTSRYANYLAPSLVVPVNDQKWHFVAVSVGRNISINVQSPDPLATAIQFTLDGAVVELFQELPAGSLVNPSPLRIGMDTIGSGSGFVGSIDEIQFFNRALAQNEFQSIFNAKCYGTCK